jgi:cystathionine beta-lyase/cystathionine gamma-synthase
MERSAFGEASEALYLTSGYVYETAEEAAAVFKEDVEDLKEDLDQALSAWLSPQQSPD